MFLCSAAASVCGLAAIGTVSFEFPNGWFLPFQENLSKMMKEVEEMERGVRGKKMAEEEEGEEYILAISSCIGVFSLLKDEQEEKK